ncbi:rhamnulokinase [Lactobacillus sp. CC-MHH1034]|uniref:rhamnulokinase n=1 Tax=Agrilactobacillus fermenti TaxID=2586909 RepID=UPI001E2A5BFD|nr:rhamnulokinase family protein [Agrilactobacillus fermenti]MCD2255563.1 rhamnulokinase [Agrilactobacillus fermenti]
MKLTNAIAVDLGASSGRLISGTYDGNKIDLKEQFRFSNLPVQVINDLHWDYMKIFQEIKYGLNMAKRDLPSIDSISIDTWGVDYGLINRHGQLLFAPHSYRDARVDDYEALLYDKINKFELFQLTGNQPAKINTVLQLFADLQLNPFLTNEIKHILFMPNLIGYFLSGKAINEFTISSTSGLLDAVSRKLSSEVFERLGFKQEWFADLNKGGKVLGQLLPQVSTEINLTDLVQVITGVGHDTASALLALPVAPEDREDIAFISSGTWSIIGQQTAEPIVTKAAFDAGLTNEGCFDGSNRLLANLTGLWIIQELQREWSYKGELVEFGQMVEEALNETAIGSYIDPNNEIFAAPNQMEEKIMAYLKATQQKLPENRGQLILLVLESLAFSYKRIIEDLARVTGKDVPVIYMFGGGIQNSLLVQLTADFTEKEVITGPVEASVMGNIVSQLQVQNLLSTADTKDVMVHSYTVDRIEPTHVPDLNAKFKKFQSVRLQHKVDF